MKDKPPVCLSCNGTKFEIKPFEFRLGLGETGVLGTSTALVCRECGVPLMNTEQMDKLRKMIDLTDEKPCDTN